MSTTGSRGGSISQHGTPMGESAGEASPSLWSKIRALPFVVKFAFGAAVIAAAYFGVVEPVLERSSEMAGKASALEASLETYAQSKGKLDAAADAVRLGERQFGLLSVPEDPAKRSTAFSSAIDDIMKKHAIDGVTSSNRNTTVDKGPLVTQLAATNRVEKIVKDLTFLATPEQLAGALADLEKEPLVTSISRVSARQSDGQERFDRKLRCSIVAETWVIVKKK